MAKTKTRRRGTGRGGPARSRSGRITQATTAPLLTQTTGEVALPGSHTTPTRRKPAQALSIFSSSGVLMTVMVTLGCWGMTIFFFFLYPDPNHVLFGVLAALMALIWSYNLSVRIRKLLRRT